MSKRFGMSAAKENTTAAKGGIFIVHHSKQISGTLSEAYFQLVFCSLFSPTQYFARSSNISFICLASYFRMLFVSVQNE